MTMNWRKWFQVAPPLYLAILSLSSLSTISSAADNNNDDTCELIPADQQHQIEGTWIFDFTGRPGLITELDIELLQEALMEFNCDDTDDDGSFYAFTNVQAMNMQYDDESMQFSNDTVPFAWMIHMRVSTNVLASSSDSSSSGGGGGGIFDTRRLAEIPPEERTSATLRRRLSGCACALPTRETILTEAQALIPIFVESIDTVHDIVRTEEVECSAGEDDFESVFAMTVNGDPKSVTTRGLESIGNLFRATYNVISTDACDLLFRKVQNVSVTIADVGGPTDYDDDERDAGGSSSSTRYLEETASSEPPSVAPSGLTSSGPAATAFPTSVPTAKGPDLFSLLISLQGTCRGCASEQKLFDDLSFDNGVNGGVNSVRDLVQAQIDSFSGGGGGGRRALEVDEVNDEDVSGVDQCFCPVDKPLRGPTIGEFLGSLNKNLDIAKETDVNIPSFETAFDLEGLQSFNCSTSFETFSSILATRFTGDPDLLTTADLQELARILQEAYQEITLQICDTEFKQIVEVTVLDIVKGITAEPTETPSEIPSQAPSSSTSPVAATPDRNLEGMDERNLEDAISTAPAITPVPSASSSPSSSGAPSVVPTAYVTDGPSTFSIIFLLEGICYGCENDFGFFNQVTRRRASRKLAGGQNTQIHTDDGVCYCSEDAEVRPVAKDEFFQEVTAIIVEREIAGIDSVNDAVVLDEYTTAPSSSPTSALQRGINQTATPTSLASEVPSAEPSGNSAYPSEYPSEFPTITLSGKPSTAPSGEPSGIPSTVPSEQPSAIPSTSPSAGPDISPSESPSFRPTSSPEFGSVVLTPTDSPSAVPSVIPSVVPSVIPSVVPSEEPTVTPTSKPTNCALEENVPQMDLFFTCNDQRMPVCVDNDGFSLGECGSGVTRKLEDIVLPRRRAQDSDTISYNCRVTVNIFQEDCLREYDGSVETLFVITGSNPPDPNPVCVSSYDASGVFEFFVVPICVEITESPSSVPSALPSSSPSEAPTSSPTSSPSDAPSDAPSTPPTVSPSESSSPSQSPTETASGMPSQTPSTGPSDAPTSAPSSSPSDVPSAPPSESPTESSSPSQSPTDIPSKMPTSSPSKVPTTAPSSVPSQGPSDVPTTSPSESPTTSASPTASPTDPAPSATPSKDPTATPTISPSQSPSSAPSASPIDTPSASPSMAPTGAPSKEPTGIPSSSPSDSPTKVASGSPSGYPSGSPSESPTDTPTKTPSDAPSQLPSEAPTHTPTTSPSENPSAAESAAPTDFPTTSPSEIPTDNPTETPTESPSALPSEGPTKTPTVSPSKAPTGAPSEIPTPAPTGAPSETPTDLPSTTPTPAPTLSPSKSPTDTPTLSPSEIPTSFCSQVSVPPSIEIPCSADRGDTTDLIPVTLPVSRRVMEEDEVSIVETGRRDLQAQKDYTCSLLAVFFFQGVECARREATFSVTYQAGLGNPCSAVRVNEGGGNLYTADPTCAQN